MHYRRIHIHDTEPVDALSRVPLAQSESPQNPRKRKLDTASHQSWSEQSLGASRLWEKPETYIEPGIYLFRRVHIKMRKPVDWSKKNKNEDVILELNPYSPFTALSWKLMRGKKAAAVHCDKPFDETFCYFEIEFNYLWGIRDNHK